MKGEKLKEYLKEFFKNRYNVAFLIIFILAIIVRLKYFLGESIWPDEAIYGWHGLQLSHNPLYFFSQQLTSEHPPLVPIMIAFFNFIFTINFAAKIVPLIFGLFGIIFTYLLGKELKNEYVGLMAATMLSFHHLYWFFSNRILLDVPLTTMFTVTAYCLIKYDRLRTRKWLWFLGVSMGLTYWSKTTGLLVLFFVGLYFLLTNFKTWMKNKFIPTTDLIKKIIYPFLIFLLIASPLFLRGIIRNGSPLVYSLGGRGSEEALRSINTFYIQQLPFIISWYIIPLMLIGLLFVFLYRKREDWLLLSLVSIPFLFFIFVFDSDVPRYILPAVPGIFILASFALLEIFLFLKHILKIDDKIFKWVKVILFIIVFLIYSSPIPLPVLGYGHSYEKGYALQESRFYSYTGFKEAGDWIKENVPEDVVLYAGSNRAMIFYSERNYENYGGTLRVLRMNETEFRRQISEETKNIYLEIDAWEWGQPDWVYPLSNEKLNNIVSMGFEPVKVIEREMPTQQGVVTQPVVFIFRLNKDS